MIINRQSILITNTPKDWDVKKIKYIFNERNETNNPIQSENLISLTHDRGVILHNEKGDIGNKEKNDLTKYKLVYPDDIVINSMNVIIGSSGVSKYFGLVSPVYYTLILKNKNFNILYFHYLFRSIVFQKSLVGVGNGILEHRMRVPMDKLGSQYLPIPSPKEQIIISKYLDKKNEQIDSLIKKIEEKLELLKEEKSSLINQCITQGLDSTLEMIDSGISWIRNTPKKWKKTRLKYLIKMISGFAFKSSEYKDSGIQLIKIGNLYQNSLDLDRSPSFLDPDYLNTHSDFILNQNDLLMSLTGTLGKRDYGFVCRYQNDKPALLNQRVGKLVRMSEEISDEYLYFYLTSEVFLSQLFRKPTGTKQGNFSSDDILSNYIWLPDLLTQKSVVEYLKHKNLIFQRLEKIYLSKLEKLKEYRESLISSIVTGKIRVTEDMI